mgnify:CR=1 FL=1
MELLDMLARIALGVTLGAVIGFERQWRARLAGLRTNALVSLGSTLFVMMGAYAFSGGDPTRVAAQVASGIGFLGAGVIMKRGANVSGINTAATLWASAAVGALAGAGEYVIAAAGTLAIVLANMLLRPLGRLLDREPTDVGREVPPAEYVFSVTCREDEEATIRGLVFHAVHRPGFTVRAITSRDEDDQVVIAATVRMLERDDAALEAAIADLVGQPSVLAIEWSATPMETAD